jgi:hypothetical protein
MILFTADWHIKLGQKNVPVAWACSRYQMFFEQVQEAVDNHEVNLHIIGGTCLTESLLWMSLLCILIL